ncbi:hypothetical protein Ancab_008876 [Ancistrocladus abbreviatus]
MLPIPNHSLTHHHNHYHPLRKPRSSDSFSDFNKSSSFSLHHPRLCLIIFIVCVQTLLLALFQYLPFSLYPPHYHRRHPSPSSVATTISTTTPPPDIANTGPIRCELGKFFVYDLPPFFNTKIYRNCDKLNPWHSRCEALSNDGYGREATGLSGTVPQNLLHTWFWTDQFATEIIFHNRILHHECRTFEPESAAAYYIPFYAGLAVGKYLWFDYSAKDRDRHCEMMLDWIQRQHPYFNRSNGWDHFITMGRITWDFRRSKDKDWGSRCIYLPAMRNITRLLIERNPWDYFDIGVPYPTGFHPSNDSDVVQWQEFVRSRDRKTLFSFAGATRGVIKNDFRGVLLSYCQNESDSCRVVDCAGTRCSNGTSDILETFLDSNFCLQPRGDSFTRRSIFDCLVAGSIPVFFWRRTAYYQYEWFLPGEPESYSVFIHRDEVKNGTSIRKVLERYGENEVKKMREKVIEFIPKFVYARPSEGLENIKDAVDVAIDGVMKRMKEQRENGYEW